MREHYKHRHGQLEQRCSSAVFLVVVRVACVFSAVAPQGCGTRVMMYTGAGWGGFGWVSLCVLVTLRAGLVGVTRGSGGAGWLGGCDGCGRRLWLLFRLDGRGQARRVRGCGAWFVFVGSWLSFRWGPWA